jgi:hypothetical protein
MLGPNTMCGLRTVQAAPLRCVHAAITEDNDANNIIGRVNGYVAATVLVDSRITEGCEVAIQGNSSGSHPGLCSRVRCEQRRHHCGPDRVRRGGVFSAH